MSGNMSYDPCCDASNNNIGIITENLVERFTEICEENKKFCNYDPVKMEYVVNESIITDKILSCHFDYISREYDYAVSQYCNSVERTSLKKDEIVGHYALFKILVGYYALFKIPKNAFMIIRKPDDPYTYYLSSVLQKATDFMPMAVCKRMIRHYRIAVEFNGKIGEKYNRDENFTWVNYEVITNEVFDLEEILT